MDFREHPVNLTAFTPELKLRTYRQMVRIRRFEQAALMYYTAGKMGGWLFLSIGQEAVSTGVRSLMGPHDHGITGPRGIGHALAAGMEMGPCMAELYGKANGCSKGKGGAFSFYAPQLHHWGCYGLAAAQTPIAAGLAFALKQQEIPGAVVCFMGDGSANQGVYHESLNLAGLFDLPVVYLIENNQYSMGTSVARSSRFTECLARRAETYDIAWDRLADDNLYELRAKVGVALDRARYERRPSVVEIETYRYYGFSVADANHKKYRTPEEIEERKANHDPVTLWRTRLIEEGLLDEATAQQIDAEAKAEAAAAVVFAEQGRVPEIREIMEDVYWETDHGTESAGIGRHFF
jgi:pyruvate dehydrogenase E1 component alpha subunit